MKPRVLLLSTSLGMGGADRQILHLARALLQRGYEARVVSMTPLAEMGREALAEGLPITSLEMERGRADWRAFQRMVTLLREWRPHLVSSFMYHANLLGRLAGRRAGVPIIVTSIRSERNGSGFRDWVMRLTNWMDDCSTINSQQVATSLERQGMLPKKKSRVIPNGIDIAALTGSADDRSRVRRELDLQTGDFLWLAIGRLLPQKDYPTLLRAFQPLAQDGARLSIAGRGPLLDELQLEVNRLGMAQRVRFLGVRNDVPALLAAADGFVLSSAWEGMPNVVMEALAAGVPVVATQVGGVAELVEPGKSGWLVPAGDSVALTRSMRELMSIPAEQRRRMGSSGRDHVAAHYGLDAMIDRWLALYDELLLRKGISASGSIPQ